ncbi:Gfo/Idh/MocA family protein [Martelella radicis]|uniref:Putative dehydrogenase n=1 Tax=Martelella radicis TaxID=1397476 RepID=A0A7W6PBC3_9HYPH|nr:Gfo/Idh/MocA family oxidoreductase [Martelella radicis]MBB4123730.1 putative dehydrogenase [Martelella radicis]
MIDKLKVAIVGAGIGEEHLQKGFAPAADLFAVTTICDVDHARATAMAARHGIDDVVTSFDDLLERGDIDVIDICTPSKLHFAQTIAALEAGKHVICEKPLVSSLREMDALEETAAAARGLLMPIFQYRFGAGVQKARLIIDSGLAGKPYFGSAETFWRREKDYYANSWRGRWSGEMGGVLVTHAIHIHDLFTHLMGPVDCLFGRIATRVNAIEVDDCASACLQMKSGALASLSATLGSQDQISRIRLMFENVTIESGHVPYAPGREPWTFIPRNDEIGDAINAALADFPSRADGFEYQVRGFHAAIADGAALPVTLADARRSIELASAFYHSARLREDVCLPLGKDHPVYDGWVPAWATKSAAE